MKINFILFISAVIITFSLIASLQFTPMPWFFLVLLCMHFGIFLFIFSKRRFRKNGLDVGKYYKREYLLLALYLPVLLAKILQSIGIISFDTKIKALIVLILTAVCLIISAVNSIFFWCESIKKHA